MWLARELGSLVGLSLLSLVGPRFTFRPLVAAVHWGNVLATFRVVFRLQTQVRTELGRFRLMLQLLLDSLSLAATMRRRCGGVGGMTC